MKFKKNVIKMGSSGAQKLKNIRNKVACTMVFLALSCVLLPEHLLLQKHHSVIFSAKFK